MELFSLQCQATRTIPLHSLSRCNMINFVYLGKACSPYTLCDKSDDYKYSVYIILYHGSDCTESDSL